MVLLNVTGEGTGIWELGNSAINALLRVGLDGATKKSLLPFLGRRPF